MLGRTRYVLRAGDVLLIFNAPGNGIVAEDGGAPWAGVTDVELPFP